MIGELRLTQEQQPVALLHWLGAGHWVRSTDYHQATSLNLVADLDPARVERLASVAGDHGLELWLQLWPTFMKADCSVPRFVRQFGLALGTCREHGGAVLMG